GTPVRGTYSLLPGVLGGDTCEGYIFISARVFLKGTPVMGTYGFHYCTGVLGGDTYDGTGLGDLPGSLHIRATMQSRKLTGKADNIVVCVRRGVTCTRSGKRIVHVIDVGQRDYIDMCITAAKRVGLITDDHSKYPLSHVGFGHVQGDDFERFQNFKTELVSLVNLLDEAKSRCKGLLAGPAGMADEWTAEELEHAAEALGYGAVKYADLKNNRLTNYTFSFDQILNEEAEELY
ncbi:anticodon-binding aminoacyl-tRNA synthetase, class 1a, partial [Tanacetum coccineum]